MRTKIGIVMKEPVRSGAIIIPMKNHQLAAHANVAFDEVLHIETQTGPIGLTEIHSIVQRVTGKIVQ